MAALGIPTRLNTTPADIPVDQEDLDGAGNVTLDLSSRPFGGLLNYHLDTLHADYAFIITPEPFTKSARYARAAEAESVPPAEDFTLYPNPTRGDLFIRLDYETHVDITLFDLSGRPLQQWNGFSGPLIHLPISHIAQGTYFVQVDNGIAQRSAKKLMIY